MDTSSRKWLRPVLLITAAVVFLVVILVVYPPDESTEGDAEAANPSGTVLPEMEIYAEHYGITVDEAVRRFEIQDAFAGMETELSIKEPETFAGLYIQHEPDFRIVALFTRDGEETVKPYIPEGLAEYVEVRAVGVSYLELQNAQSELSSALSSLGIPADSYIDIGENSVKFNVVDLTQINEAVATGALMVPDYVFFVEGALVQPE